VRKRVHECVRERVRERVCACVYVRACVCGSVVFGVCSSARLCMCGCALYHRHRTVDDSDMRLCARLLYLAIPSTSVPVRLELRPGDPEE